MQFNLNVAFTDAQLELLYATGTNVIVAKPSSGGSTPDVAWQVFQPLEANTITWQENYGLYASTQAITGGALLTKLSSTPPPATDGDVYTLQPTGVISAPQQGGIQGSFSLLNQYSPVPYMTVGLYQDANVNGTDIASNAISAAPVLLQSTAVMTPYTTVYIWLQSGVQSNCVVTTVTSPMTQLQFGGAVTTISVAYNSATGTFVPTGSQQVLANGEKIVKTIKARL